MEEKDIKELWKQGDELNTAYSQEDVEKIIQLKPKDIVSKFIKTLKIEKALNAIVFSLAAMFFIYEQNWILSIVFTIINTLFFVYYKKIIQQLSNESFDTDVAQYLCNVYKDIKRFVLHYKILLWVITVPAYTIGIYIQPPEKFNSIEKLLTLKVMTILIAGLVISVVLAHVILYFMYGKKANKIKKMVDALNLEEV
jgi:hypothetical protein